MPNSSNPDTLKYRVSEPCAMANGLQWRIGATLHESSDMQVKGSKGQGSRKEHFSARCLLPGCCMCA